MVGVARACRTHFILVATGAAGVLAALLLCGVQAARAAAARAACQNHLRQVAVALHAHHDRHGGLPPGPDTRSTPGLSWMGHLLPEVGQEPLWTATRAAYRADWVPFHVPPHVGYRTGVAVYACPADGRLPGPLTDRLGVTAAYGSYLGVAGGAAADGPFDASARRLAGVTDGTSQTLLVGERPPPDALTAGRWYTASQDAGWGLARGPEGVMRVRMPASAADPGCVGPVYGFRHGEPADPCDRYHFWSLHPGGANFAFCDGSVRFLPYSADAVLPALATRAGGEVVAFD